VERRDLHGPGFHSYAFPGDTRPDPHRVTWRLWRVANPIFKRRKKDAFWLQKFATTVGVISDLSSPLARACYQWLEPLAVSDRRTCE
jgi:hypothetical protein